MFNMLQTSVCSIQGYLSGTLSEHGTSQGAGRWRHIVCRSKHQCASACKTWLSSSKHAPEHHMPQSTTCHRAPPTPLPLRMPVQSKTDP